MLIKQKYVTLFLLSPSNNNNNNIIPSLSYSTIEGISLSSKFWITYYSLCLKILEGSELPFDF